jgi:hypothetical protein
VNTFKIGVHLLYWLLFLVSAPHHSTLHIDGVFPLFAVYSTSPTTSTLTPSLRVSSTIMEAIGDATASAAASRIDVIGEEFGSMIQGGTMVDWIQRGICL